LFFSDSLIASSFVLLNQGYPAGDMQAECRQPVNFGSPRKLPSILEECVNSSSVYVIEKVQRNCLLNILYNLFSQIGFQLP
jgi:hypothetical protein